MPESSGGTRADALPAGLSEAEAARRLGVHGPNVLRPPRRARGLLGFGQEHHAAGAVERVLAPIRTTATVVRDGRAREVPIEAVGSRSRWCS